VSSMAHGQLAGPLSVSVLARLTRRAPMAMDCTRAVRATMRTGQGVGVAHDDGPGDTDALRLSSRGLGSIACSALLDPGGFREGRATPSSG